MRSTSSESVTGSGEGSLGVGQNLVWRSGVFSLGVMGLGWLGRVGWVGLGGLVRWVGSGWVGLGWVC